MYRCPDCQGTRIRVSYCMLKVEKWEDGQEIESYYDADENAPAQAHIECEECGNEAYIDLISNEWLDDEWANSGW